MKEGRRAIEGVRDRVKEGESEGGRGDEGGRERKRGSE